MIRFGIVGCGHIAQKHVEAIEAIDEASLYALCDTNCINIEKLAANRSVKQYVSFANMLADDEIDVVIICTPSGLHAPMTIQAAQAGKHVVVEKPMALTMEDADAMIRACEDNDVLLSVVHPNRFRPAMLELKKMVEEGRFGTISHVNATVRWNRGQSYYDQADWRGTKQMDGGVLMNQGIHSLDLLQWLIGPIEEVKALTGTRLRHIEVEDVAVAAVRFANGVLGVVETATTIYRRNYEETIAIFGEQGSVIVGGPTANWVQLWEFESMSEEECEAIKERINNNPFGIAGHQQIISDMVGAITQGQVPAISGVDGRDALAFVLGIYEAAHASRNEVKEGV
ncbi:Gfo/Idh/MocA family protein [Paenibacillus sp. KN14-4R]|uniref:Gfo/Idh/MocA family protein n=1 Tax=Paenibacillus sp. KN14-4R TaxID=3445773 RepID=UPI003FA06B4F